MDSRKTATAFAILAAALYAVNVPVSKMLLENVAPTMMAAEPFPQKRTQKVKKKWRDARRE